jgi:hypothetical protein
MNTTTKVTGQIKMTDGSYRTAFQMNGVTSFYPDFNACNGRTGFRAASEAQTATFVADKRIEGTYVTQDGRTLKAYRLIHASGPATTVRVLPTGQEKVAARKFDSSFQATV